MIKATETIYFCIVAQSKQHYMIGIVQFQTRLLSFLLIVVHYKINIDHSPICYFQNIDIMKEQITAFSLPFCVQTELLPMKPFLW